MDNAGRPGAPVLELVRVLAPREVELEQREDRVLRVVRQQTGIEYCVLQAEIVGIGSGVIIRECEQRLPVHVPHAHVPARFEMEWLEPRDGWLGLDGAVRAHVSAMNRHMYSM